MLSNRAQKRREKTVATVAALTQVLQNETLSVEFQPIWNAETETVLGFEAFARFPDQTPPREMWDLAIQTDAWADLDRLAIQRALAEAAELPGLLFLNVCARWLESPADPSRQNRFLDQIKAAHGMGRTVIDLRESVLTVSPTREQMSRLWRQQGLLIALDDAGGKKSSPDLLHWLRPNFVKIDRPLVEEWLSGRKSSLLEWIGVAKAVHAEVIAERVENAEALSALVSAGINYFQGYAVAKPEPANFWQLGGLPLSPPSVRKAAAPNDPVAQLSPDRIGAMIFQAIPLPMFILDVRGRVVQLNPMAAQRWGATLEEIAGVPWIEAFHIYWDEMRNTPPWDQVHVLLTAGRRLPCVMVGRNGQVHSVQVVGVPVQHQGQPFILVVIPEAYDSPLSVSNLPSWALTDVLTGLNNRAYWELERARWDQGAGVVGIGDLDQLKWINDTRGHQAGDEALARIGSVLARALPPDGVAIRFGGDEFLILLSGSVEEAVSWGNRVNQTLAADGGADWRPLHLSWGWSAYRPGELDTAIAAADTAMYSSKGRVLSTDGGGRIILTQKGDEALLEPAPFAPGSGAAYFRSEFDHAFRKQFERAVAHARSWVDWVDPQPGIACIEVGSGTGRIAFEGGMAHRIGSDGQLLLTDPAAAQLQQAKQRTLAESCHWVHCLLSPAENLPVISDGADLCLGSWFLHLCHPPIRAIREMARVVRPGGLVAIASLLKLPLTEGWQQVFEPVQTFASRHGFIVHPVFEQEAGDVIRLCELAGLIVERSAVMPGGVMQFPDAEQAWQFLYQGGHVHNILRDIPPQLQLEVEHLLEEGLALVYESVGAEALANPFQEERVLARKPL